MVIKALINKIKGPLLALDEDFKKSDKSIDDLVDETLKWFDDMEVLLNNKLGKQKNTNRKRNIRSTQVNSVNSVLDCTIATRTRAAQKAIRESQAITVSVSNNEKHNKKTRESQDQNVGELSCPKRPAEEEILIHNNSKKIKREKLSIVENETFKMPYPKGVDVKDSVEPPKPAKRTKRTATQKNEDSNKNVSKINSPKEVTKTRNSQTISQSTLILEPQTSRIFENINTISPLLKNGIPKERSSTKAQGIGSPAESRRSKISRDKANNSVDSEFNNVLPAVKCSTPKERSSRRSLCSPINKHSPVTSTVNTGIIDETMSNSMLCQAKSSTPKECFMERTYALRSPQTRKDSRKSITVIETADETISNSVVVETETCTPKKILDKICALLSSDIKPSPPRNVKANTEKKTKEESRTSDSNLKRSAPAPAANEETNEEEPRNKRTRKARTKQKENNDVETDAPAETQRITRTKAKQSQAVQEAEIKSSNSQLSVKSVAKNKVTSPHQNKLKIFESQLINQKLQNRILATVQRSASKNEPLKVLPSKIRLPLAGNVLNSHSKLNNENIMSTGKSKYLKLKNESKPLITPGKGSQLPDIVAKSSAYKPKEEKLEKELKLKALKEKEEEALIKREMALKNRQKELKEKNEMKLKSAMKQRQKLESEKYNNIVQSEKEKEAKRQMLLQERELKLKEKTLQKKIMIEKKLAETEERRRLEEEARIAKLKEQEAEQQRIMLEKQKALELHEKMVQDRLADQKAREKFEMKLKEEQMKEKMMAAKLASKMHSASKMAEQTGKKWNYKARNENDYGLEDENSDEGSMLGEEFSDRKVNNKSVPEWAKRVLEKKCPVTYHITEAMIMDYMPCYSKTPDIRQMFKMTPSKKILRTSSAIWDTPNT